MARIITTTEREPTVARKKTGESAPTKTTSTSRKPSIWVGIGAIALGVILLAYIVYGVVLSFADLTDGFTQFWTTLFFYPAANILTDGYLGWTLLGLLLPLLIALVLAKIVWYGAKGKTLPKQNLIGMGVVLLVVVIAQFWIPPLSNSTVGYGEYVARVEALDNLQQQQQQLQQGAQKPDASVLHASALQQLVQGDIIRQVAGKLDVKVSSKEVNDFYKQMADQNQGEANLKKQLKELLGWTPGQFKQEIKLRLLQEKIAAKLGSDEKLNADSKQKAEDYLKQVQGGKDFGAVAKEASSGTQALTQGGGDQPTTIKKGETDPAVESYAFKANPGDVSGVIKTQGGFVIVKVVAKPNADEVQVQQILVAGVSVNDYFTQQLKDAKVNVYVHDLVWNKELYAVQPKNGVPQPQQQPQVQGSGAPAAAEAAPPAAPAVPAQ